MTDSRCSHPRQTLDAPPVKSVVTAARLPAVGTTWRFAASRSCSMLCDVGREVHLSGGGLREPSQVAPVA